MSASKGPRCNGKDAVLCIASIGAGRQAGALNRFRTVYGLIFPRTQACELATKRSTKPYIFKVVVRYVASSARATRTGRTRGKSFVADELLISQRPPKLPTGPSRGTGKAILSLACKAPRLAHWWNVRHASRYCFTCRVWEATKMEKE